MRIGSKKALGSLIFSIFFALTAAAPAYADKTTGPLYPHAPNLVWNVKNRSTVVVHILNTTPFDMQMARNGFANYYYGDNGPWHPQDGYTQQNSGVFSPSGIPYTIPRQSGASFVVSWLDTALNKGYDKSDVFADVSIDYTMKQVLSNYPAADCYNGVTSGDITVHLDFNRVKQEQNSLKSAFFSTVVDGAILLDQVISNIEDPSPTAILGYLLSAASLSSDAKELEEHDGDSNQAYFSAYVLPPGNSLTNGYPGIHNADPCTTTDASDAAPYAGLYSQQPTATGCPQAYIISAVAVQREVSPDDGKLDGHLPAIFVVLVTIDNWTQAMELLTPVSAQASPAAYMITQQLQREGRKGQIEFVKLRRTLSSSDRAMFDEAYKTIWQKKALSHEQEAFLLRFAEALEKHAAQLVETPEKHTLSQPQTNTSPVHHGPVRK
ncbi:MAG TPA: hypothetical protein VN611_03515 [Patescibacteria group bacterium]|nr:hypothetical protein [Patescibacteria group bacterium]